MPEVPWRLRLPRRRQGGGVPPGGLQPGRGQGLRAPPDCVRDPRAGLRARGCQLAPACADAGLPCRVAGYGPCLAATIHLHNAKASCPACPDLPGGTTGRSAGACRLAAPAPPPACKHLMPRSTGWCRSWRGTRRVRWAATQATPLTACTPGSPTPCAATCTLWTPCWPSTSGAP